MTKKGALTSILVALALIAGGLGVYYYFFLQPAGTETEPLGDILNPFGQSPTDTNTETPGTSGVGSESGTNTETDEQTIVPLAKLRQLSNEPVAGATIFDRTIQVGTSSKDRITKTYIRFVEKGTGHISEVATDSSDVVKVSNTTIPKIYEAVWGGENNVIFRYLNENDVIQTYSAVIPRSTTTEPAVLDGVFLSDNISDIHFSPQNNRVFYLTSTGRGIIATPHGKTPSEIYSSPTAEWLGDWFGESTISLTTKASSGIPGYNYFLNTRNGSITKVLSGISGLTTKASPSGAYILYTESSSGMRTALFDVKKQTSTSLSTVTLPDKCVWNAAGSALYCAVPKTIPVGSYPDGWYQGRIHFSDSIWKITPSTGDASMVFDPEASNRASIDATYLTLSSKENVLILINKNDSTLWSLDLTQ